MLGGKIEFESGEEGREWEVLSYLLRTSTAEAVRAHLRGTDFAPLVEALDGTTTVSTGEQVTAAEFLAGLPDLGESDLYEQIATALGATDEGTRASAIELAFEALYLARKIAKDSGQGETIYG